MAIRAGSKGELWGYSSMENWLDEFVPALKQELVRGGEDVFSVSKRVFPEQQFARLQITRKGEREPLYIDVAPGPQTPFGEGIYGRSVMLPSATKGKRGARVIGAEMYVKQVASDYYRQPLEVETRTPLGALANYISQTWDVGGYYTEGTQGRWSHILSQGRGSAIGSLMWMGDVHSRVAQAEMARRVAVGAAPGVFQGPDMWEQLYNQVLYGAKTAAQPYEFSWAGLKGYAPYKADEDIARWVQYAATTPTGEGPNVQYWGIGTPEKATKHQGPTLQGGIRETVDLYRMGPGGAPERAIPSPIFQELGQQKLTDRSGYRMLNVVMPGATEAEKAVVWTGMAQTKGATPLSGAMITHQNVLARQGIGGAFREGPYEVPIHIPHVGKLAKAQFLWGSFKEGTPKTMAEAEELRIAGTEELKFAVPARTNATIGYYSVPTKTGEMVSPIPITYYAEQQTMFAGKPTVVVPAGYKPSTGEPSYGFLDPAEQKLYEKGQYNKIDYAELSGTSWPGLYNSQLAADIEQAVGGAPVQYTGKDVFLQFPIRKEVGFSAKQGVKTSVEPSSVAIDPRTGKPLPYSDLTAIGIRQNLTTGGQQVVRENVLGFTGEVKNPAVTWLRGGFGALPVDRQISMMTDIFGRKEAKPLVEYLKGVQAQQQQLMQAGLSEAELEQQWVAPSIEQMAARYKGGEMEPWRFVGEMYSRFTQFAGAKPERALDKYRYAIVGGLPITPKTEGYSDIQQAWIQSGKQRFFESGTDLYSLASAPGAKSPTFSLIPGIRLGPVTPEEQEQYQTRLSWAVQEALSKKGLKKDEREALKQVEKLMYKFEPIPGDVKGRSQWYIRTPYTYSAIAAAPTPEDPWGSTRRLGFEELAAINLNLPASKVKQLGFSWTQNVGATGDVPPHVAAWRSLAKLYAYQDFPGIEKSPVYTDKTLQLAPGSYTELTTGQITKLQSTISSGMQIPEIQLELNKIVGKGILPILKHPETGALLPAPSVMEEIAKVETGPKGEELYINRATREYAKMLLEWAEGGTYQPGSAMGRFAFELARTAGVESTGKTLSKMMGSKYTEQAMGGRFIGATGMGLNTAIISETSLNTLLEATIRAAGFSPTSKRKGVKMTRLEEARGEIETAGALPAIFAGEPIYGRGQGVMAVNLVTPKMLRKQGLDFPEATRFGRSGKMFTGDPAMTGILGAFGIDIERLGRDLDLDPGFITETIKYSPNEQGVIDFLRNKTYDEQVKAVGQLYLKRQTDAMKGLVGVSESGVPGGEWSGYVRDVIGMAMSTSDPLGYVSRVQAETGINVFGGEEMFRRGMGWNMMKSGMGISYNVRRRLEAAASSLGWSEEAAGRYQTSGSLSYAKWLEQKTAWEEVQPRHLEQAISSIYPVWGQEQRKGGMYDVPKIGVAARGIDKTDYRTFKNIKSMANFSVNQAVADIREGTYMPENVLESFSQNEQQAAELIARYKKDIGRSRGKARQAVVTEDILNELITGKGYDFEKTPVGLSYASAYAEKIVGYGREQYLMPRTRGGDVKGPARSVIGASPLEYGGQVIRAEDLITNQDVFLTSILTRFQTGRGGVALPDEILAVEEGRRRGLGAPLVSWASIMMGGEEALQASETSASIAAGRAISPLRRVEPLIRPHLAPAFTLKKGDVPYEFIGPGKTGQYARTSVLEFLFSDVFKVPQRLRAHGFEFEPKLFESSPEMEAKKRAGHAFEAWAGPRVVKEMGLEAPILQPESISLTKSQTGLGVRSNFKIDIGGITQVNGEDVFNLGDVKWGTNEDIAKSKTTSPGVRAQITTYASMLQYAAQNLDPKTFLEKITMKMYPRQTVKYLKSAEPGSPSNREVLGSAGMLVPLEPGEDETPEAYQARVEAISPRLQAAMARRVVTGVIAGTSETPTRSSPRGRGPQAPSGGATQSFVPGDLKRLQGERVFPEVTEWKNKVFEVAEEEGLTNFFSGGIHPLSKEEWQEQFGDDKSSGKYRALDDAVYLRYGETGSLTKEELRYTLAHEAGHGIRHKASPLQVSSILGGVSQSWKETATADVTRYFKNRFPKLSGEELAKSVGGELFAEIVGLTTRPKIPSAYISKETAGRYSITGGGLSEIRKAFESSSMINLERMSGPGEYSQETPDNKPQPFRFVGSEMFSPYEWESEKDVAKQVAAGAAGLFSDEQLKQGSAAILEQLKKVTTVASPSGKKVAISEIYGTGKNAPKTLLDVLRIESPNIISDIERFSQGSGPVQTPSQGSATAKLRPATGKVTAHQKKVQQEAEAVARTAVRQGGGMGIGGDGGQFFDNLTNAFEDAMGRVFSGGGIEAKIIWGSGGSTPPATAEAAYEQGLAYATDINQLISKQAVDIARMPKTILERHTAEGGALTLYPAETGADVSQVKFSHETSRGKRMYSVSGRLLEGYGGRTISETNLLKYMLQHPGEVAPGVTREDLLPFGGIPQQAKRAQTAIGRAQRLAGLADTATPEGLATLETFTEGKSVAAQALTFAATMQGQAQTLKIPTKPIEGATEEQFKSITEALKAFEVEINKATDLTSKKNVTEEERDMQEGRAKAAGLRLSMARRIPGITNAQAYIDQLRESGETDPSILLAAEEEFAKEWVPYQGEAKQLRKLEATMGEETKGGTAGMGRFFRRALGGFGLMYLQSIAGFVTGGMGWQQQPRETMDMLLAQAGTAGTGQLGTMPINQIQRVSNLTALSGQAYNPMLAWQGLRAQVPLLNEAQTGMSAGLGAYAGLMWYGSFSPQNSFLRQITEGGYELNQVPGIGKYMGGAKITAGKLALGIGLASLVAQAATTQADTEGVAFRQSVWGQGTFWEQASKVLSIEGGITAIRRVTDKSYAEREESYRNIREALSGGYDVRRYQKGGFEGYTPVGDEYGKLAPAELLSRTARVALEKMPEYSQQAIASAVSTLWRSGQAVTQENIKLLAQQTQMGGIDVSQLADAMLQAKGMATGTTMIPGGQLAMGIARAQYSPAQIQQITAGVQFAGQLGAEVMAYVPGMQTQQGMVNQYMQFGQVAGTQVAGLAAQQWQNWSQMLPFTGQIAPPTLPSATMGAGQLLEAQIKAAREAQKTAQYQGLTGTLFAEYAAQGLTPPAIGGGGGIVRGGGKPAEAYPRAPEGIVTPTPTMAPTGVPVNQAAIDWARKMGIGPVSTVAKGQPLLEARFDTEAVSIPKVEQWQQQTGLTAQVNAILANRPLWQQQQITARGETMAGINELARQYGMGTAIQMQTFLRNLAPETMTQGAFQQMATGWQTGIGVTAEAQAFGWRGAEQMGANIGAWVGQNRANQIYYERLRSFSPTAFAEQAQQLQMAGQYGQAQQMARWAVTDVGVGGQLTGLGLFTTGLGQGVGNIITPQATAGRMWGNTWQGTAWGQAAVFGINTQTGQIYTNQQSAADAQAGGANVVGGTRGLQYQQFFAQQKYQEAMIGNQWAQIALQEEYMPKFWALEDKMRNLGYRQTEWGFQMQERQMALGQQQFNEQMGLQYTQMQMQRGWAREDWGYQDVTRNMQWGWRQEDFQEQIRFMTGRQRKLAERQMERETIMHGMEGDQIDRQRKRQEELWALEDQRFEMQKRHYEENMKLQEENLKKQREFFEERKKLEEESVKLHREYQLKQLELQKQAIGAQAQYTKEMNDTQKAMMDIGAEQDNLIGQYTLAKEKQVEMINAVIGGLNYVIEKAPGALASIVGALTGGDGTPIPPYTAPEGGGGGGGGGGTGNNPKATRAPLAGQLDLAKAGGMKDKWANALTMYGGGGGAGQQVINLYVGNELLARFVLNTVKSDLEVS